MLLDASGRPLLEGLREIPFALKPNEDEIRTILGTAVETPEEAASAARKLLRRGHGVCCISLGKQGAVLAAEDGIFRAKAIPVEARGIQGAGDSLVAGMTAALLQELGGQEALRYAVAAAAGSIQRAGTQMCTRKEFEKLLEEAEVETCAPSL